MAGELTGENQSTGEIPAAAERNPQAELRFGAIIEVNDTTQSGKASSVGKTFLALGIDPNMPYTTTGTGPATIGIHNSGAVSGTISLSSADINAILNTKETE